MKIEVDRQAMWLITVIVFLMGYGLGCTIPLFQLTTIALVVPHWFGVFAVYATFIIGTVAFLTGAFWVLIECVMRWAQYRGYSQAILKTYWQMLKRKKEDKE